MAKDILRELSDQRRADAFAREKVEPYSDLLRRLGSVPEPRDFRAAFRREHPSLRARGNEDRIEAGFAGFSREERVEPEESLHASARSTRLNPVSSFQGAPRIIAELKKASPSEGMIREDFAPAELAEELADAGAAALSVLCEPHRFLGGEEYLRAARRVVDIPILYKDFITTRYQIACARAAGADAVLLIAAVLSDAELVALRAHAHNLGMSALVETHDEREIRRAVALDCEIIGVNCRDLRSFTTDTSLIGELIGKIPKRCVRIAESGMHDAAAIQAARAAGADGFLVGTALMRAPRPGLKLQELGVRS